MALSRRCQTLPGVLRLEVQARGRVKATISSGPQHCFVIHEGHATVLCWTSRPPEDHFHWLGQYATVVKKKQCLLDSALARIFVDMTPARVIQGERPGRDICLFLVSPSTGGPISPDFSASGNEEKCVWKGEANKESVSDSKSFCWRNTDCVNPWSKWQRKVLRREKHFPVNWKLFGKIKATAMPAIP